MQLATALGFLLVPIAIAARWGATLGRAGAAAARRAQLPALGAEVDGGGGRRLPALLRRLRRRSSAHPKQEDIAESFGAVPVQVLLIVVAAPISEEVCFRGMLFGGLRERLPRLAAALISALVFGGLHALTGVSAVPPLIAFGFILALLYEKTGSIVPGILLHMLNNSVRRWHAGQEGPRRAAVECEGGSQGGTRPDPGTTRPRPAFTPRPSREPPFQAMFHSFAD